MYSPPRGDQYRRPSSSPSVAVDMSAAELAVANQNVVIADLNRRGQEVESRAHAAEARAAQVERQLAVANEALRIANAAAAAINVVERHRHVDRPKFPISSHFMGVTGNSIDEWLQEQSRQHSFFPQHFTVETHKIQSAVAFFSPKVQTWYHALEVELAIDGNRINTFDELSTAMRRHYQPVSSSMAARNQLDRCRQVSSVNSYNTFFYSQLNLISDMGVSDQVHRYTAGLQNHIRIEVLKAKPTTLSDAVNVAVAAEAYSQMSISASRTIPSNYASKPRYGQSSSSSSSSAMDVSNINFVGSITDDDHDDVSQRSQPSSSFVSPRERQLEKMLKQYKIQSSVNAMFGQHRQQGSSSSSYRNKSEPRVVGISKEDVARCRLENRCLKCKVVGHLAR